MCDLSHIISVVVCLSHILESLKFRRRNEAADVDGWDRNENDLVVMAVSLPGYR